jgi:hypothetical protein
VVLVVDKPNLDAARPSRADGIADEIADRAGQTNVVERELERLAGGLDEVDDAAGDGVGGLAAVAELVELEALRPRWMRSGGFDQNS